MTGVQTCALPICFPVTINRKQEESLDAAIKRVRMSGHQVTLARLEEDLVVNEGVHFISQNSQLIKTAARLPTVMNDRKVLEIPLDPLNNMVDAFSCINMFKTIITNNVKKHGIETTCAVLNDSTREQQAAFITALALIPSLFFRVKDNCPSLYFWGEPCSGKSYFFESNPSFRKIPMDAAGVSRFRLEGAQTAFLMDDVKADAIDRPDNSSTIRQLALGAETRIKTFGETQTVKAFLVLTSNEKPNFLCPIGEPPAEVTDASQWRRNRETNNAAWKRRFITLYFSDSVDSTSNVEVHWEHDSALFAVARTIDACMQEMSEPCREALSNYLKELPRYCSQEMEAMEQAGIELCEARGMVRVNDDESNVENDAVD